MAAAGDAAAGRGDGDGPGGDAEVPALHPQEVAARLQRMRRELSNRRKILVRNLPRDSSSQEVHDLLKDYELKYCYVDRNKRTAFVTLLDGEQARGAIRAFHQHCLRGRDLVVQLQPTDALLCVSNLPASFTLEEFEELVRAYGNIERCFLVYSEVTGHSKGYGFVEYMKKDFAARARLELLGKQLGASALCAQWMDANLLAAGLIHSKCLCVDKLPGDFRDSEELLQVFSRLHKPVFCQLAQDVGSYAGGFAVVEYPTAAQAEEMRQAANGMTIRGTKVQVSFCAPGAPGRSTLAALIAAQRVTHRSQKGLLPEPNLVQILKSLSNPALLQALLRPPRPGWAAEPAALAVPPSLDRLLGASLLHLRQAAQSSVAGGVPSLLLPALSHASLSHAALAQKLDSVPANNKPGLLGEAPAALLPALGPPGDAPRPQSLIPAPVTPGLGVFPFFPKLLPTTQEKQTTGVADRSLSGPQPYLQNVTSLPVGGLLAGPQKPWQGQPKGLEATSCRTQTSLLGEPPREVRLSKNPYLNLASVLPSVFVPPPAGQTPAPKAGGAGAVLDAPSQGSDPLPTLEKGVACPLPFTDYAQVSLRNEKRGSAYLLSGPEGGAVGLVDPHAQGPGAFYMETYLKKKRVY